MRRGGSSRSGACGAQVAPFFARLPARVVGIGACGAAPYWGRESRGHAVRLIPAAYVKPFVRRSKTAARAAAASGAARRHPDLRLLGLPTGRGAWAGHPRMALKSAEQQAARGLERARALLVKPHTQLGNSVRRQLAAHGLVAAQGRRGFAQLAALLAAGDARLLGALLPVLRRLREPSARLAAASAQREERIGAVARADPALRRLAPIPGGGPIRAHAIVAAAGAGRQFGAARPFAAWAGLPPRPHARAGKRRATAAGARRSRSAPAR